MASQQVGVGNMKRILVSLAVLGFLAGAAQAQQTKTMAVSIPTADHGWTGGVVFHAMEEAKALEKKYPGPQGHREDVAGPRRAGERARGPDDPGHRRAGRPAARPERADRPDPQGQEQGDVRHGRRSHRRRPVDLRPLRRRRQSGSRRVGGRILQEGDAERRRHRRHPRPADPDRQDARRRLQRRASRAPRSR